MKEEIRYVVTVGRSPEPFSCAYSLVGVFRAKETAQDVCRKLRLRDMMPNMFCVTVGKEYRVSTGWESDLPIMSYIE